MPTLFPFDPDWASPVEVEIAYKTETITSRSYREQRIALRDQPRKTIRFEVSIMRGDYRRFMEEVSARQQAEWVIPEVTRATKTSLTAISGAVVLTFVSRPSWIAPLSWIVVRAPSGMLLRQVTAVTATTATFAIPLPEITPDGTEVCPGLIGRLSQSMRATTPTNAALRGRVELLGDPGANVYEASTTAPLTFNGRELWLRRSNWATVPSVDFDGQLETVDHDTGVLTHFAPVPWNVKRVQREFVLKGLADADEFTAFLHRMRGQQGEFYAPTGNHDFDLTTGALAGSPTLVVPSSRLFDLFATNPTHRAVFVRFADGSYQANVVTEIALSGVDSEITVATPWVQDVTQANVRMASWLHAMRLSTDTVMLQWLTRTVAQAKLTLQTLEDLP